MLMMQRYRYLIFSCVRLNEWWHAQVRSERGYVAGLLRFLVLIDAFLLLTNLAIQVTRHLRVHLSLVISSLPLIEVLLVLLH